MLLSLGEPPMRFFVLLLLLLFIFDLLMLFILLLLFIFFQATLPCHGTPRWLLRPVKASTSSELYPGYFWLLYFFRAFPSDFYRERNGFERAFFTHRRFYLALLPHILARFVTQIQAGTPHPGSSSVPALAELSLSANTWP